jgi:hypothetical protein
MMKYGAEHVEHRFRLSYNASEPRGQWRDIYLNIHMENGQALPEDLLDPSVLVITNQEGHIVQVVLQDEGCDCEFQFTLSEKAQVESFVEHLGV